MNTFTSINGISGRKTLVRPGLRRKVDQGFTLIEILAAVFVLALLIVLVAQLMQSGMLVISGSRKNLNAAAQAREVFNCFALDVLGMPKRVDLSPVVSAGNDKLFFYSEAPGFSAASPASLSTLSLVGYRVTPKAQLDRLGKALTWAGAGSPVFLTYTTASLAADSTPLPGSTLEGAWASVLGSSPDFNGSDPDSYHLLADGVFRIAFTFQNGDGSYSLAPGGNVIEGKLENTGAIILTLAILDGESRKMVTNPGGLAAALPDISQADLDAGNLPASLWNAVVSNAGFAASAGIPQAAAAKVRIYQRTFPLNTP